MRDDEKTAAARVCANENPCYQTYMELGNALAFQMRYHEAVECFEKAKIFVRATIWQGANAREDISRRFDSTMRRQSFLGASNTPTIRSIRNICSGVVNTTRAISMGQKRCLTSASILQKTTGICTLPRFLGGCVRCAHGQEPRKRYAQV